MTKLLNNDFFQSSNVVKMARALIGQTIVSEVKGQRTSGMIVETEAYSGLSDLACHASVGKTNRTQVMYKKGGHAYVYLCYGIHEMLNIVTNDEEYPDAVLIRALAPLEGIATMRERRKHPNNEYHLTSGPGKLTMAMGIDRKLNEMILTAKRQIWIESGKHIIDVNKIKCSPRIGVSYAKNDAWLPWRFYLEDSPWVSSGKFLSY